MSKMDRLRRNVAISPLSGLLHPLARKPIEACTIVPSDFMTGSVSRQTVRITTYVSSHEIP